MHLLITGANGFVGRNVCLVANRQGFLLTALSRHRDSHSTCAAANRIFADIETFVRLPFRGPPPDAIIHLAARAHETIRPTSAALSAFRSVNRDATLSLAQWAACSGVRRFVYVSSIGVNGNLTHPGLPINELSPAAPHEAYAISKHEAEIGLQGIANKTGLEVCIVRPPLVYGPGAPGNFRRLVRLVRARVPLPFGAVDNRRSFIYVENLADALVRCATHPAAANKTFVICDETVSTPQLLRMMAAAMDIPMRLFSIPMPVLRFPFVLTGRAHVLDKLTCNLEVDDSYIRRTLAWRPQFSMKEALTRTFSSW